MADSFVDVKLIRKQTNEARHAEAAMADENRKKRRAEINEAIIEASWRGIDFILVPRESLDDVLRKELEMTGYSVGKNMNGMARIGW